MVEREKERKEEPEEKKKRLEIWFDKSEEREAANHVETACEETESKNRACIVIFHHNPTPYSPHELVWTEYLTAI